LNERSNRLSHPSGVGLGDLSKGEGGGLDDWRRRRRREETRRSASFLFVRAREKERRRALTEVVDRKLDLALSSGRVEERPELDELVCWS